MPSIWSRGFYRSGALVFGGGHVVLPLLNDAVVAPGWVSQQAFLAGLRRSPGRAGAVVHVLGLPRGDRAPVAERRGGCGDRTRGDLPAVVPAARRGAAAVVGARGSDSRFRPPSPASGRPSSGFSRPHCGIPSCRRRSAEWATPRSQWSCSASSACCPRGSLSCSPRPQAPSSSKGESAEGSRCNHRKDEPQ